VTSLVFISSVPRPATPVALCSTLGLEKVARRERGQGASSKMMQSTGQTFEFLQTPQSTHSSWSMTATSPCMLMALTGQYGRHASQEMQMSPSILIFVSPFLVLSYRNQYNLSQQKYQIEGLHSIPHTESQNAFFDSSGQEL
jgi:hypothetical protein